MIHAEGIVLDTSPDTEHTDRLVFLVHTRLA